MKATQQLKDEHSAVLLMLQVLERMIERIKADHSTVEKDLPLVIDFLRGFVDRCHHGKEEELLFPAMEAAGIPRNGGPIGVMLHEHDAGRSLIQAMINTLNRLGQGEGQAELREAAHNYIELLTTHISKENEILFNMADQKISAAEQDELYEKFEELELERMGLGKHEEYHELLHRLIQEYGVKA